MWNLLMLAIWIKVVTIPLILVGDVRALVLAAASDPAMRGNNGVYPKNV
jgi:hypothetical protein